MQRRNKKIPIQVLLVLAALALLLYLIDESRQRTRRLNNNLKDISTGIHK